MTLKLQDSTTSYNLSFNVTNVTGNWTLTLKSQLSHLNILDTALTVVTTNNRYTEFSFDVPQELPEQHKNGIYEYTITNGVDTEVGLLKLICGTGGTDGYTAYESNNEEREAPIYYRPNY
jgi:hypothetical protein